MIVFCDNFLPCVVGKTRWKKHMTVGTPQKINDFVSVSDEAFTLLLMENVCWDIMQTITVEEFFVPKQKRKRGTQNRVVGGGTDSGQAVVPGVDNSIAGGRKLLVGKWTKDWRGSKRFGGWAPEGIARYNELVTMVVDNRKEDVHFQAQYEIHLRTVHGLQPIDEERVHQPMPIKAFQDISKIGI
jgi:hypothetical protein